MTEPKVEKIKAKISDPDWNKLMAYCRYSKPNEVGGLAHAEIVNGKMVISNPFILDQEVSGGAFEIDRKALVKFISEYPDIHKVRCIWHSHVDMSAFFSGCDREASNQLASLGQMMQGDNAWFVSLVVNVRGDYECKVDIFKPLQCSLAADIGLIAKDDEVERQVKAMCRERKYHYSGGEGYYGQRQFTEHRTEGGVIVVGGVNEKKSRRGGGKSDHKEDEKWDDNDIFGHFGGEG